MKLITTFLIINSFNLPISHLFLSTSIGKKAMFIQNNLNAMHLALFKGAVNDFNDWNELRYAMVDDLKEATEKIDKFSNFKDQSYDIHNFIFSGFKDEPEFLVKKINAFFNVLNLKEQITLEYTKYSVLKSEVIEHFTSISNENVIIESVNFLGAPSMDLTEKWKHTLYMWIGEKTVLKGETINVILKRFEYDKIEYQGSNTYIAWFNYFKDFPSVPVKIIVKEEVDKKEIYHENSYNWWFFGYLLSWVPAVASLVCLFFSYIINAKNIWIKFKSNLVHKVNRPDYEVPLIEHNQNDLVNDIDDNLAMVTSVDNSAVNDLFAKAFRQFLILKKSVFFNPELNIKNSDVNEMDLTTQLENWDESFDAIFEDPEIESHNLNYMKWGIFDTIRYGKMNVKNFPHEFIFKVYRRNFQQPSENLINEFYQSVKKMFSDIYISKDNLRGSNAFLKVSKVIIDVLNNSKLKILGNNYLFSSDSFWVEEVALNEEFVDAKLNHSLFAEPIPIKINFI